MPSIQHEAVVELLSGARAPTNHHEARVNHDNGRPGRGWRDYRDGRDYGGASAPAAASQGARRGVVNHIRHPRHTANADAVQRDSCTRLIRAIVPETVRGALEELLATKFPDPFIDGFIDQGRVEGEARAEARLLLRMLAGRGIAVPDGIGERITSCADIVQLEAWFGRASRIHLSWALNLAITWLSDHDEQI